MTREQKDLLLKDICARLPYKVKVGTIDNDGSLENVWDILWYNTFTEDIKLTHSIEDADKIVDISEVKPYLFPLSTMTKKQRKEYAHILVMCSNLANCQLLDMTVEDWFHKNHFDYRGLIPMGLANDATGLGIYENR